MDATSLRKGCGAFMSEETNEDVIRDAYNEGHADGWSEGYEDGRMEGQEEGYGTGYDDGKDEGETPESLSDRIRRAGLPHLEDISIRFDAASKEIVLTHEGREVRWS